MKSLPITSVPLPSTPEGKRPPRPEGRYAMWVGYLPPAHVERLYARITTGVATQGDRDAWMWHWYRVVAMVMRSKMGNKPEVGWYWFNGWIVPTKRKPNARHLSLFEYLLDCVLDLTYRPDLVRTPKTSASVYFNLRYSFWMWKAQWELIEAGVGGIKPFERGSINLGKALVDYHYWRTKAQWWYDTDQPTVAQAYDLLAGNVPEMLPEGDELRKDRRPMDPDKVMRQWIWFNEVLTPQTQPTVEL